VVTGGGVRASTSAISVAGAGLLNSTLPFGASLGAHFWCLDVRYVVNERLALDTSPRKPSSNFIVRRRRDGRRA
jgi:hypothetical protein